MLRDNQYFAFLIHVNPAFTEETTLIFFCLIININYSYKHNEFGDVRYYSTIYSLIIFFYSFNTQYYKDVLKIEINFILSCSDGDFQNGLQYTKN